MRAVPTLVGTHLKRYGELPVVLTLRMLAYWHRQINEEFFQGALPTPGFAFGELEGAFGYWWGDTLTISPTECSSRHLFITTMAHEMVHQWQAENGFPLEHDHRFHVKALSISKHLGYPVE